MIPAARASSSCRSGNASCRGGYLGWGKSTQLGHGLGLIMGAKLANPGKLCINVMGDASIGMVGMDIETAVRNRIGILTSCSTTASWPASERHGSRRAALPRGRSRRQLQRGGARAGRMVETHRARR